MSTEELIEELAKPEDATQYIEQRREDAEAERPRSSDEAEVEKLTQDVREKYNIEDKKLASRGERRKRAQEALKAENEQLRSQLEGRSAEPEARAEPGEYFVAASDPHTLGTSLQFAADKHGNEKLHAAYDAFVEYVKSTGDKAAYQHVMSAEDPGEALVAWHEGGLATAQQAPEAQAPQDPYEAALEQGRQQANFDQAIAQREAQIRHETACQYRVQDFAKYYPDYHETLESIAWVDTVPAPLTRMLEASEFGPAIAYWLAKDAYEGDGTIFQLDSLQNNPIACAQFIGRCEQLVRNGFNQRPPQQRAITHAPPPVKPITGGSAPTDLHSLSQSDDATAYIAARRGRNA